MVPQVHCALHQLLDRSLHFSDALSAKRQDASVVNNCALCKRFSVEKCTHESTALRLSQRYFAALQKSLECVIMFINPCGLDRVA